MPAYRSNAEGEIRRAVVDQLRRVRPGCRIIHEINVEELGNRIDVLAVSKSELVAVEIKSERDTLERLGDQLQAYRACAHMVVVALHEKFLVEDATNRGAAHEERDGKFFMRKLPDSLPHDSWVYPLRRRALPGCHDWLELWRLPHARLQSPCPEGALKILWREELQVLCHKFRVITGKGHSKRDMRESLRWHCTGAELTKGICSALMARNCVEADPPVYEVS